MNRVLLVLLTLSLTISAAFAEGNRAIAVLLDVSKSVPADDLQNAKEVTQKLLDRAAAGDTISIYVFGNEFRKIAPDELAGLESSASYTLLYDSTFDVARDLRKIEANRKAILIITDGLDTKSATVLEDAVRFANENGIAIYGIGVGKVNRKSLERISKLTGGKYFSINTPTLVADVELSIDGQEAVAKKTEPAPAIQPATPAAQPTVPAATTPVEPPKPEPSSAGKPEPSSPKEERWSRTTYFRIAGAVGASTLLVLIILLVARVVRKEQRGCPTCGRILETYQTICPECSKAETTLTKKPDRPGDSTQEFGPGASAEDEEDLIPVELLEKRPVAEESLTNTFVLMETPMLVVRKGKSLGQSFALNRAFPVSIGRSRVNEIHLDDVTVSGQHCRIVPEVGRHVLYDLGSTNGTLVNDKKISKAVLKEGDIIKVGETQFLYKIEQHRS